MVISMGEVEHTVVPRVDDLPEELALEIGDDFRPPFTYRIAITAVCPWWRLVMPQRTEGLEHIPTEGPVILAGNHVSHLDPIYMITGSLRRTYFLAKKEHFESRWLKPIMRTFGQIMTDREAGARSALRSACGVVVSGGVLGIFPEGTRSRRTEAPFLAPGRSGVARLAATFPDVPVHPVALIGTRDVMTPKRHRVPRLWRPVLLRYGAGLSWRQWLAHPRRSKQLATWERMLACREPHEQQVLLNGLHRGFTNEIIGSLKALGAP